MTAIIGQNAVGDKIGRFRDAIRQLEPIIDDLAKRNVGSFLPHSIVESMARKEVYRAFGLVK